MRVHLLAGVSLLSLVASVHAQEPVDNSAPPAGNPAPPPSDLEAGGLRPPEAVDSAPPTAQAPGEAQVEQELEKADSEDTGRGLEFVWVNGEVGYQMAGLATAVVDGDAIGAYGGGVVVGAGLGVRLLTLTLGGRFRYSSLRNWDMWSLNAEGAFHIPLGRLDVYFGLGAGYVSLSDFREGDEWGAEYPNLAVRGLDVRFGAGLDYYISSTFSVGVNLGGEVMFLKRDAIDIPANSPTVLATYAKEGSGLGGAGTATAVLGLHF